MDAHIQSELDRITARLAAYPVPNEHAGLYAAQQALCWAAQPDAFAAPYLVVTGIREGSEDYQACRDPLPS